MAMTIPGGIRPSARILLLALLGAATGYLLWEAYYLLGRLKPGLVASIVMNENVELVGAWFGSLATGRRIFEAVAYLTLATPGALLVGVPVGVALRYVAHKRSLLYAVLAWPLGKYAYSTFVLRVLETLPEQQQVELWYSRGAGARDALFIYSSFFAIVFLVDLIPARMRRRGRASR